jgi:hypothetical protein
MLSAAKNAVDEKGTEILSIVQVPGAYYTVQACVVDQSDLPHMAAAKYEWYAQVHTLLGRSNKLKHAPSSNYGFAWTDFERP